MKATLIGIIRFYHLRLSPLLHLTLGAPTACRFVPTCSEYAVGAIETHGIIKGLFLSVTRILRCHPASPGGFDPVPPKL